MGARAADYSSRDGLDGGPVCLRSRIARLRDATARPGRPARSLNAGDRAGALGFLLREVDETVLPRRIILTADTGARLDLDVMSRRVLSAGGDAEGSDPQAAGLIRRIDQLLTGARNIDLSVSRLADTPADHGGAGCPAALLAKAAGLDAAALEGSDPALSLYAALADFAVGRVQTDRGGRILQHDTGAAAEDPLLNVVRDHFSALDDQLAQNCASADAPGCLILGVGGKTVLLFARGRNSALVARVPSQSLRRVQAIWDDSIG